MADNKLVSDKMYRLTIEGMIPIELAGMPTDELAAVIINGFSVNLGVTGTITKFNCELLQQIPQQNTGQ
jgi:hypothetical protein